MNVALLDWIIVAVCFLMFLGLAIYLNTFIKNVADFLVSGRKVRMWLGMGAGIAGEVGLVSIVSTTEQGFIRGFGFVLIALLGRLVMIPLFGIFGFGIERFRATKAVSVPQYIEMRYSKGLRIITGFFNSMAGVLQMSIFPIVGANFLAILIGAPDYVSLAGANVQTSWIIMVILLICVVLFTSLGGFITLMVGNFFQMIVIMGSITWLLIVLVGRIDIGNFWTQLEQNQGLAGFYPFAPGSEYGLMFLLWLITMSIMLQFSFGPYLQRNASMDKPKTVTKSYFITQIHGLGRTLILVSFGAIACIMLGSNVPEGLEAHNWSAVATPHFLGSIAFPGLMGLFLAGLLFADISTTDQYVMTWATSIVNDCIVPFKKKRFSVKGHIRAVKLVIFVLCIFFFFVGIFYSPTMPILEYLWLCANIIGGTGIAVLAGMYWKRATTAGAYAAVFISLVLPIADLIARRIYLARGIPFPWDPKVTGFGTYFLAASALVILSLLSTAKTKYWDLGDELRKMNKEE